MEKDRPSFSAYRRHVYRRIFGRSLSTRAVITKDGSMYAVENSFMAKCLYTLILFAYMLIFIYNSS